LVNFGIGIKLASKIQYLFDIFLIYLEKIIFKKIIPRGKGTKIHKKLNGTCLQEIL